MGRGEGWEGERDVRGDRKQSWTVSRVGVRCKGENIITC